MGNTLYLRQRSFSSRGNVSFLNFTFGTCALRSSFAFRSVSCGFHGGDKVSVSLACARLSWVPLFEREFVHDGVTPSREVRQRLLLLAPPSEAPLPRRSTCASISVYDRFPLRTAFLRPLSRVLRLPTPRARPWRPSDPPIGANDALGAAQERRTCASARCAFLSCSSTCCPSPSTPSIPHPENSIQVSRSLPRGIDLGGARTRGIVPFSRDTASDAPF